MIFVCGKIIFHYMHIIFILFLFFSQWKDSWQQVGVMLVTSFNCAYVLSFSNLMLVPLGWAWGISCLIMVGAFAFYANWLLADFHIIDEYRFIRYRDLMGYVFGIHLFYFSLYKIVHILFYFLTYLFINWCYTQSHQTIFIRN